MSRTGMLAAKSGTWKSGHCNRSNPPKIHEQCRGAYAGCTCTCECHTETETPGPTISQGEPVSRGVGPGQTTITAAGLVRGMADETYHGDPVPGGSLSSTFARQLTIHVPAKARARFANRKPTKSMNLGKAAHLHALGAGPGLIVWQHDGRTKGGKAERAAAEADIAAERVVAVTAAERDQILDMAEALRATPEVAAILDACEAEVSAFWQEGDVWLRARYDLLSERVAYDYKTAEDASAYGFEHAMSTYGYHQQAEFYQRGLHALGHAAAADPMRFIVQETQDPYLVQVHTCDPLAIEVARALNDRAIDIYAAATKSGRWPGYPDLHAAPTGLPNRYFYRYADLIPAHLNPVAEPEMSM